MKKYFRKVTVFICGLFVISGLIGCGDNIEKVKEESELKPLTGCMWEVKKGDNIGYLVGTIHAYEKGYRYTNENLEKIMKHSDGLAVEVDITDEDEMKIVTDSIMAKEGETIEDILTNDELQKFKAMCTELGIVYETVKMFNGYGISSIIEGSVVRQAGLTEMGYDQFLINEFKKSKKEIISIEGAEFQVAMLQEINNDDKISQLANTYNKTTADESVEANKELFKAFIDGDISYMDSMAKMQSVDDKEAYDIMLTNRNINMANKADELIQSGKVYTIAVGTMHYVGPGSVIEELEAKGYTVTEIE